MENKISTKTENTLEFFATVILTIGLFLAFAAFIFGCSQENGMYNPYGTSPMLIGLITGVCIAISTFLIYAPLKIFINISLRLQELIDIMSKDAENSIDDK